MSKKLLGWGWLQDPHVCRGLLGVHREMLECPQECSVSDAEELGVKFLQYSFKIG